MQDKKIQTNKEKPGAEDLESKLRAKNTQRQHAIGSMQKEIRDIRQTIDDRDREVST